nr:heavy metal-binding domain-containing protein [Cupriavidus taiwanensis]
MPGRHGGAQANHAHHHEHAHHHVHAHEQTGTGTEPAPGQPPAEGTIYTCPMHPEIRQDHPGNCPKCGMTLEPLLPELDEGDNPELVDFRRRFWWTLPLTGVVFVPWAPAPMSR